MQAQQQEFNALPQNQVPMQAQQQQPIQQPQQLPNLQPQQPSSMNAPRGPGLTIVPPPAQANIPGLPYTGQPILQTPGTLATLTYQLEAEVASLRSQVVQLRGALSAKTLVEEELQHELAVLRSENLRLNETLSFFMKRDKQLYPEVLRTEYAKVEQRAELEQAARTIAAWFETLQGTVDKRMEHNLQDMFEGTGGSDREAQTRMALGQQAQGMVKQLQDAVESLRKIAEESLRALPMPDSPSE